MKPLFILSVLSLLFAGAAMAEEGPCASFATYGAMRAYRSDPAVRRASEKTKYDLNHVKTRNEKTIYLATVTETGDRDDSLAVKYFVTVEATSSACRVIDVTKTGVSDF